MKEKTPNDNNNTINDNNPENKDKNENIIKDQKYYNQEVKKFMNINSKDSAYLEKIEKNPDTLFEFVDEYIIENWEKLLTDALPGTFDDKVPSESQIMSVQRDTEFQKVINNDCKRTRVRESVLIENFKEILENIITYYCKFKNVYYKQGLNEIFGPLLLMKYKYQELTLSKIFLLGETFIDKFLPNYFYEKELFSLKSSLGALLILLRYHEPSVYNRLDSMDILPEMYGTNWVMTLLLGKVKLEILYNLWDNIIRKNDPLFMHYFFVSMIINRREMIINCDRNILPTLMASLTIVSNEELQTVFTKAEELIIQTPYSFRILVNKLGFLVKKNNKVKNNFERYKPLSIPAMPIFPLETFYITYHSEIECPYEKCKTSINLRNKHGRGFEFVDKDEEDDVFKCEKCDMKVQKNMNFFLLDLRILEYGVNKEENESDKTGYLPKMINVDQEELKSEEINDIITNRYINERGKYHFIFLTTNTDAFLNFEEKFYKDNISEEDQRKIMFGLMEKKTEKELNFDIKNISKKQLFKLKEYDNLRKILKSLKKQNYPYIGFVYDGFEELHKESSEYGIELLFHNNDTCILCKQKKKKDKIKNSTKENKEKTQLYESLWEHKEKMKYQNLVEKISKDEACKMFLGSLLVYKNRNFETEKIQILIISNNKEFKFDIYKYLKNQNEIISKSGYYGLGIDDNDDNKDRDLIILEQIYVFNINKLSVDKKNRNILNFEIIGQEIENEKNKKKDKKKDKKNSPPPTYNLSIDFSSSSDAKIFFSIFKKFAQEFKNKNKNKK